MFREAFWRRVKTGYGTKWIFRKRRESDLARFIAASSIRYSVDECLQLPPKVYVQKECEFPAENWQYYDQIIEELTASRGNYREVKNSFLRMRQIASGFVGFKDDETGERAQIEFAHNPKLDLLMALIEQVPSDQKMVIFHEFTWSGARICQALTKLKIEFGWLWSGTKDWTQIKEAFKDNPNFRVIVANWKKASMGLNLQSASYMFFYESPVSAIERYESEGRIYRNGQKRKSMIYDVMVKDSVDERIREFHAEGRDLYKALVDNPATIIGRRKQRIL
jgi:SNF2 family DNA or RNA helicase